MRPESAAQCARYGVETLEEVLRIKMAGGLSATDAIMAMVDEQMEAERAEHEAAHELAHKVTCPYCGAGPGNCCRRVRGKWVGQQLRDGLGQIGGLEYHKSRYNSALVAELDGLLGGPNDP